MSQGKELYRVHGPLVMRALPTVGATLVEGDGPILEPIDIDAVTRGIRAGIVRASRASNGLPEICRVRGCGAGFVCEDCKKFRKGIS